MREYEKNPDEWVTPPGPVAHPFGEKPVNQFFQEDSPPACVLLLGSVDVVAPRDSGPLAVADFASSLPIGGQRPVAPAPHPTGRLAAQAFSPVPSLNFDNAADTSMEFTGVYGRGILNNPATPETPSAAPEPEQAAPASPQQQLEDSLPAISPATSRRESVPMEFTTNWGVILSKAPEEEVAAIPERNATMDNQEATMEFTTCIGGIVSLNNFSTDQAAASPAAPEMQRPPRESVDMEFTTAHGRIFSLAAPVDDEQAEEKDAEESQVFPPRESIGMEMTECVGRGILSHMSPAPPTPGKTPVKETEQSGMDLTGVVEERVMQAPSTPGVPLKGILSSGPSPFPHPKRRVTLVLPGSDSPSPETADAATNTTQTIERVIFPSARGFVSASDPAPAAPVDQSISLLDQSLGGPATPGAKLSLPAVSALVNAAEAAFGSNDSPWQMATNTTTEQPTSNGLSPWLPRKALDEVAAPTAPATPSFGQAATEMSTNMTAISPLSPKSLALLDARAAAPEQAAPKPTSNRSLLLFSPGDGLSQSLLRTPTETKFLQSRTPLVSFAASTTTAPAAASTRTRPTPSAAERAAALIAEMMGEVYAPPTSSQPEEETAPMDAEPTGDAPELLSTPFGHSLSTTADGEGAAPMEETNMASFTSATPFRPGYQGATLTFDDFSSLAQVRFFADFSNRRRTSFMPQQRADLSELSYEDRVQRACVAAQEVTAYTTLGQQLETYMSNLDRATQDMEAELSAHNSPLMQRLNEASEQEKVQMRENLKNLRNFCRLSAKQQWHGWLLKLEQSIENRLAGTMDMLKEDSHRMTAWRTNIGLMVENAEAECTAKEQLKAESEIRLEAAQSVMSKPPASMELINAAEAERMAAEEERAALEAELKALEAQLSEDITPAAVATEQDAFAVVKCLSSWKPESVNQGFISLKYSDLLSLAIEHSGSEITSANLKLLGGRRTDFEMAMIESAKLDVEVNSLRDLSQVQEVLDTMSYRLGCIEMGLREVSALSHSHTISLHANGETPIVAVTVTNVKHRLQFVANVELSWNYQQKPQLVCTPSNVFGAVDESMLSEAVRSSQPAWGRLGALCCAFENLTPAL